MMYSLSFEKTVKCLAGSEIEDEDVEAINKKIESYSREEVKV